MPTPRTSLRASLRAALAAVATALALVLGAGTAAALPAAELRAVTDDYVFARSLPGFTALRVERPYADQLDWSSDGCSSSPDQPFGYAFLPACHRHDFGYRNYKRQARFTAANRLRIDDRFLADMYSVCGGDGSCRSVARVYYSAVRLFGGSGTSTAAAVDRSADARALRSVAAPR